MIMNINNINHNYLINIQIMDITIENSLKIRIKLKTNKIKPLTNEININLNKILNKITMNILKNIQINKTIKIHNNI